MMALLGRAACLHVLAKIITRTVRIQALASATRGRGIVVSSGAKEPFTQRGPADVSNIATFFGLTQQQAKVIAEIPTLLSSASLHLDVSDLIVNQSLLKAQAFPSFCSGDPDLKESKPSVGLYCEASIDVQVSRPKCQLLSHQKSMSAGSYHRGACCGGAKWGHAPCNKRVPSSAEGSSTLCCACGSARCSVTEWQS